MRNKRVSNDVIIVKSLLYDICDENEKRKKHKEN